MRSHISLIIAFFGYHQFPNLCTSISYISHNPPRNILYKAGAVRGALFGVILPGSQFFPKNTIFKSRCPPGTRNVSTITILYVFPLYINDNSWVCTKNRPRGHNYQFLFSHQNRQNPYKIAIRFLICLTEYTHFIRVGAGTSYKMIK